MADIEKVQVASERLAVPEAPNKGPFGLKQGCNEIWAIAAFLLHLVAFVAISLPNIWYYLGHTILSAEQADTMMMTFLISCFLGLLIAYIFLYALRYCPKASILCTICLLITACLLLAIYSGIVEKVYGIINIAIFLYLGLNVSLYYNAHKGELPFSAGILKKALTMITEMPQSIAASILAGLLRILYTMFFYFSFWGFVYSHPEATQYRTACLVLYVCSLSWTWYFIDNVLHVVLAGTFSTAYFTHGADQSTVDHSMKSCVRRTLAFSSGTSALGSFLLALIWISYEGLKYLLEQHVPAIVSCVRLVSSVLSDFLLLINALALIQVAIYGKNYFRSIKDTFLLFKGKSLSAAFYYLMIRYAILNTQILTSVLYSLWVPPFLCDKSFPNIYDTLLLLDEPKIIPILPYLFIYVACKITTDLISAAYSTLLVCACEDPQQLTSYDPLLREQLHECYPELSAHE